MIEFKTTDINIGVVEPNSVSFINFEYTGDTEDIVYVQRLCGCTGEHVYLDSSNSKQLQFSFKESDVKSLTKQHIDSYYQDGFYPFDKGIIVFLADDEPLKIINPNNESEKIFNMNKKHIKLSFRGFVKIDKAEINK